MPIAPIKSERLLLVSLPLPFLEIVPDDLIAASELVGLHIPVEMQEKRWLLAMRRDQLRADPTIQEWLLWAVALPATREMIGYIGFHGPPGAPREHGISAEAVEIGYTIFPAHQQQGYAREAFGALMDWAVRTHGIAQFVVSIRPDNTPSQRLAAHFGFRKVGSQIDEIDGLEEVFVREVQIPPPDA